MDTGGATTQCCIAQSGHEAAIGSRVIRKCAPPASFELGAILAMVALMKLQLRQGATALGLRCERLRR